MQKHENTWRPCESNRGVNVHKTVAGQTMSPASYCNSRQIVALAKLPFTPTIVLFMLVARAKISPAPNCRSRQTVTRQIVVDRQVRGWPPLKIEIFSQPLENWDFEETPPKIGQNLNSSKILEKSCRKCSIVRHNLSKNFKKANNIRKVSPKSVRKAPCHSRP